MHSIIEALRAREDREEGFTLIELMVVVLIIAILIAIAIPTFLGAQNKAKERAAQSDLRNALTAAKTIYTDNQIYTDASTSALAGVEPSLQYVTTASTGPKVISVASTATSVSLAAWSTSGKCFAVSDVTTLGTAFEVVGTTQGSCTAPTANAAAIASLPATTGKTTAGNWAQAW